MVSCRARYKRNGIACEQPLTGVGKNKRTFLAAQDSPSICHQCSRMCMPADASSLSRLHLEYVASWYCGHLPGLAPTVGSLHTTCRPSSDLRTAMQRNYAESSSTVSTGCIARLSFVSAPFFRWQDCGRQWRCRSGMSRSRSNLSARRCPLQGCYTATR